MIDKLIHYFGGSDCWDCHFWGLTPHAVW